MSTQIWTPGAAGPLDELINRLMRMVQDFMKDHELEQVEVRIELVDGSHHTLESVEHDPGYGFFSFVPHREAGEEPRRLVIPIGAVKLLEISAPDPSRTFGFSPAT